MKSGATGHDRARIQATSLSIKPGGLAWRENGRFRGIPSLVGLPGGGTADSEGYQAWWAYLTGAPPSMSPESGASCRHQLPVLLDRPIPSDRCLVLDPD